MVELKDFSVAYPDGTVAVKNISFAARDGENVALVGANGAGKTTLLLAMTGVIASSGRLAIDGTRLSKENLPEIRRLTGLLFQNPDDQLFCATIYDDIAFGPRNTGLSEEETARRVNDCLSLLKIERLRDRTPLKLSGGEKRMAALAAVLSTRPRLLLLDEPTAFLDSRAARDLTNALKELPQTKIIATHDLAFAFRLCERALLMKDGRLFADVPVAALKDERLMNDCGAEPLLREALP